MALRDGRTAGRTLGGGGLDGMQRSDARMIPAQLERSTRHYRRHPLRIGSPAPVVTSITPAFGPMTGGTAVTIVGDFFDMVGPPFISPQSTGSNPTSVVVVNEQTITCVWGACPWFGGCDVYIYNHEVNLAGVGPRVFRYQPFEQVGATLFFRSNRYSVTAGVGTWKSSERGGPLYNYYPAGAASSAPTNDGDNTPTFGATSTPLTQADTMANWLGTGDCHTIAVIDLVSVGATAGYRAGDAIWTDSNGSTGLCIYNASGTYYVEFWARVGGVDKRARTALGASSGRFTIQGKKSGGNLRIRLNNGAWVAGDACGTTDTGGTFIVGQNYNATANLRAKVWALGVYNDDQIDATFSDLIYAWSGAAFPTSVVTRLDLDSRHVTQGGGVVTVLLDQSGNGFDATAPGGSEPTYNASNADYAGIASVDFPTADTKYLEQTDAIATGMPAQFTMFLVGHTKDYAQVGNGYFVMTKSGNTVGILSYGRYGWSPYGGSLAPLLIKTNPAIRSIVAVVFTGGDTARLYQNSKFSRGNTAIGYGGEVLASELHLDQHTITAGFRYGQWQGIDAAFSPAGPFLRHKICNGALTQLQIEAELATLGALYNIDIVGDNARGITGLWDAGNYDDAFADFSAVTDGRWLGRDTTGPTFGQDWLSPASPSIPTKVQTNALDVPQFDGVDDYCNSAPTGYPYTPRLTTGEAFAADGSAGTIIVAINPPTAPADTTNPITNPGIVVDSGANMGLHWSDAGFSAEIQDSGGIKSVSVAALNNVDHIAIMRWGAGTLQVARNAVAGVITWQSVSAGSIVSLGSYLLLGATYSLAAPGLLEATISGVRLFNRKLTDLEINAEGVEIQNLLGWSNGFSVDVDHPIVVTTAVFVLTGTATGLRAQRKITATLRTYALTGTATGFGVKMPATAQSYSLAGPAVGFGVTMPATARSYVLTGTATGLTKQSKIVATARSYALAGTATGLTAQRKISCTAASFAVTGNAAGLTKQSKLTATAQAYALTGTATGLQAQRKITATAQSYTLTRNPASFAITRGITATARSYVLTGTATFFGVTMPATSASYALSGQAVAFGVAMPATARSYSLTGNPAGFGVTMPAAVRALSLVGQDAGLSKQSKISATAQSYSLAGPAVGFGVKMLAAAAAFALVMNNAGLALAHKIVADPGAIALVGNPTGPPALTRRIDAQAASYALNGTITGLRAGRELLCDGVSFAFVGGDAQLGVTMPAAARSYVLSGQAAGLTVVRELFCVTGAYALGSPAVGLTATRRLALSTGVYALSGQAAGLQQGKGFQAVTGAFVLAGTAASFVKVSRIAPSAGAFVLGTPAVGLYRGFVMPALGGTFALAGGAASGSFTRRIAPSAAAFTLAAPDVVLRVGLAPIVHGQTGIFVLTGVAVQLVATYVVAVAVTDDVAVSIAFEDGPSATIDYDDGPSTTIALEDGPQTVITMSSGRFYDVGDDIEVTGTIRRRLTGALIDPDVLTVYVLPPSGVQYSIVYDGIDPRIVRDSQGVYRTVIPALAEMADGEVVFQYNVTGDYRAMQPHAVRVRAPRIVV